MATFSSSSVWYFTVGEVSYKRLFYIITVLKFQLCTFRLFYSNIYALVQRRLLRISQQRRRVLDGADIHERSNEQDNQMILGREDRDMSVTVIGALLWPTISSIVGR